MYFIIISLWLIGVFMGEDHVRGAAVPCQDKCSEPRIEHGRAALSTAEAGNNTTDSNNGNDGIHDNNAPTLYDASTVLTVQCNESYWFKGTNPHQSTGTIRCDCQGRWDPGEDEACVEGQGVQICRKPPPIADALDPPDKVYHANEVFRYTCRPGYLQRGGGGFRRCNATTKTWDIYSYDTRQMRCEPVDCGYPSPIPNADEKLVDGGNTSYGAEVEYSCKTGYSRKAGFVTWRFCQANATWSWIDLECDIGCRVPTNTDNLHVVHHAARKPLFYPFDRYINHNESVQVSCVTGFVLNSTQANTKQTTRCEFGAWTSPKFSDLCVQAPCGLLDWQKAGMVVMDNNNAFRISPRNGSYVRHGATVEVTCKGTHYIAKLVLSGNLRGLWVAAKTSFIRVACARGKWNSSANSISCRPRPCVELSKYDENLSHINYSTDPIVVMEVASRYYINGTSAAITCLDGFETRNHESTLRLTCTEQSWNKQSPICGPTTCSKPQAVAHSVDPPDKTYQHNERYRYICLPGYERRGGSYYQCDANSNTWEPLSFDTRRMICEPVNCGWPSSILNADKHLVDGQSTSFGAEVRYQCKTGYVKTRGLLMSRKCQVNGRWTDISLQCDMVSCPPLTNPSNGKVAIRRGRSNRYKYQSEYMFTCDSSNGYRLKGKQIDDVTLTTCTKYGNWSHPPSTIACELVDCYDPGHIYNGHLQAGNTTYPSQRQFGCNDFTTMEPVYDTARAFIICQKDGRWSKSLPNCRGKCRLPNVANGYYRTTWGGRSFYSNALEHRNDVNLHCYRDYTTDIRYPGSSTKTLTCDNGTLTQGSCTEKGCRVPDHTDRTLVIRLNDGNTLSHPFDQYISHGDWIYVACEDGFVLNSTNTNPGSDTQCNFGEWTDPAAFNGKCIEVSVCVDRDVGCSSWKHRCQSSEYLRTTLCKKSCGLCL